MQIVAMTDFYFGQGSREEIIRRGDSFTPPGTGVMNAYEQAQSLINGGTCCHVDDWPKRKAASQAGYDWAKAEVARLNAGRAR